MENKMFYINNNNNNNGQTLRHIVKRKRDASDFHLIIIFNCHLPHNKKKIQCTAICCQWENLNRTEAEKTNCETLNSV